jgi:hypothetical protein
MRTCWCGIWPPALTPKAAIMDKSSQELWLILDSYRNLPILLAMSKHYRINVFAKRIGRSVQTIRRREELQ